MTTYVFMFTTGHRHFVSLNIQNPPLRFEIPIEPNVNVMASLFLFGGNAFNVEVVSPRAQEDPAKLASILMHIMCGLWDALGLSIGAPHNLRFEGFFNLETGASGQLSLGLPKFDTEIAAAGLEPHDWISVSVSSPQLRAALRDIRLAMETPGEVAVHCYRAIERVRQFFATNVNRKRSWESLTTALNVHRTWLDSYTAHATAVRHGEIVELENHERDECLKQAAVVVIRFAAYLKGGQANLTASPFLLLT